MCSRWRPSLEGPRASGFRFQSTRWQRRTTSDAQVAGERATARHARQKARDGNRRTRGSRAGRTGACARVPARGPCGGAIGVERPRRPVEQEARARGVELLRRDGAARRRVPERRNAPRGAGSVRGAQADERRRARRVEGHDGRASGGVYHLPSIIPRARDDF